MGQDEPIRSGGPPEVGFILLEDEPSDSPRPEADRTLGDVAEELRLQEDGDDEGDDPR